MDDAEKQFSEIRMAVLNLINSDAEKNQRIEISEAENNELKTIQNRISERLEKIEKYLSGQNGRWQNK